MAVLDTLKVVIEGDASGLQSAFTVATRVLQKLEAALDRLEASASKHTQATDRIAAAHTRMAATTKVAADKTAAVQAKAERDFFKLAQAAERASAREAASAGRAAAAVDRSIAKIHAAQERTKRDYDKAVAAAERAATREKAAADRAAAAVSRAADKKAAALSKAAAKQEASAERSTASWAKEIAIFQRYRAALYLVGAGLQSVYKIAEDGARAAAAEQYFRNAGKSIVEFRTATQGLISDAELMKKVNLADTMGLSGEVFKTLANVAHASAAKTGQSYEHMLNSIVLGTARESRLLLDNLGIIINVTDAKKAFAKSLKEGADAAKYSSLTIDQLANSLTDAGEKAAFFADVERTGQGALLEQAKVGATAADNFDRFAAAVDNLRIAIGKLLATGPGSLISQITKAIGALADEADRLGRVGVKGVSIPKAIGQNLPKSMSPGNLLTGLPILDLIRGTVKDASIEAEQDYQAEYDVFKEKLDGAGIALEELDRLNALVRDYPDDALDQFGNEILDAADKVQDLAKTLNIALPKFEKPAPPFVDPDALHAGTGKGRERVTVTDFKAEDFDVVELMRAYGNALWDAIALKADATFQRIAEAARKAFPTTTPQQERMRLAIQMGAGAGGTPGDIERAGVEQGRRDLREQREAEATEAVGQTHSILSAFMDGSASDLGAAIGGFFGPLGVAIGSLLGELLEPLTPVIELMGHLASGIKGLLELGLNPFLETLRPLGPALELLLRSVGVLIAGALRPLIPHMQALVFILTAVIDVVALVIVFWATVAEIAVSITSALLLFWGALWNIVTLLTGWMPGGGLDNFTESMGNAVYWIDLFTKGMVDAIVTMNNGIVSFIRELGRGLEDVFGDDFGLRKFGDKLEREDLMPDTTPIEENTDATGDNTRAVEQLSRDLRNLPSGYKVNYALYGATAPVRQYPNINDSIGAANRFRYGGNPPNYRWRT